MAERFAESTNLKELITEAVVRARKNPSEPANLIVDEAIERHQELLVASVTKSLGKILKG